MIPAGAAALGVNLQLTRLGETSCDPEAPVAKAIGKAQAHASVIPELGDDGNGPECDLAALRPVLHPWNGS